MRGATALFERLEPGEEAALAELATRRTARAGERLIERWDQTRELYVLEDGSVDVLADGDRVATLRSGDFFGEIGALDWGAGFARSRVASVVAREDVRVRVLEPAALAELFTRFPRLEREIRHTAHERMRETR
jgi:CRP-like cAMP-binding protein